MDVRPDSVINPFMSNPCELRLHSQGLLIKGLPWIIVWSNHICFGGPDIYWIRKVQTIFTINSGIIKTTSHTIILCQLKLFRAQSSIIIIEYLCGRIVIIISLVYRDSSFCSGNSFLLFVLAENKIVFNNSVSVGLNLEICLCKLTKCDILKLVFAKLWTG